MFQCKTCEENFPGEESYKQHMEGEKHKSKILTAYQNNPSVNSEDVVTSFNSESQMLMKCEVCDLSFDSFESFQSHSLSPDHALKIMLNQSRSLIMSYANNNHELDTPKSKQDTILPELSNSKSPSFSYERCSLCAKEFSGPEPYKQHIDSQGHKKKVALLQNQTSVGITLKCDPCGKTFSGQVPYAQHMSSEVHKKKLQNIEYLKNFLSATGSSNSQVGENKTVEKVEENKLWFCCICNKQCSGVVPYEQHLAGAAHLKNAKRAEMQNNFVASNINQSQIFEKSENVPSLVNSSYLKDYEQKRNDFVLPGALNGLKIVSEEELAEKVKVISPDEELNFDESQNGKSAVFKQSEIENDDGLNKIQNQNGFDDNLKKDPVEEKKSDVYEICKICNVPLLDKDTALEHYESKEHFEKRWKM